MIRIEAYVKKALEKMEEFGGSCAVIDDGAGVVKFVRASNIPKLIAVYSREGISRAQLTEWLEDDAMELGFE
jgi:hypothetical protein